MPQDSAAVVLQSVIWAGAFAVAFYWPWQKVCVDRARDRIFDLRDQVFDMATDGRLEFGSESYEKVRDSMNAMIRLAHGLTFPRFAATVWFGLKTFNKPGLREEINAVIATIPDSSVRNEVSAIWNQAVVAILEMIAIRSLFAVTVGIIIALVAIPMKRFAKLQARVLALARRPLESAIRNEIRQGV